MNTIVVQEAPAGVFSELFTGQSFTAGDVLHGWQVAEVWSDVDLAAIGVFRVVQAEPPEGTETGSRSYQRVDGVVTQVLVTKPVEVPAPGPLPEVKVSPRQARLALLGAGLLDATQTMVDAAGGATKISWEYATEINRADPLISLLGTELGLTAAQIDELFRTASTL